MFLSLPRAGAAGGLAGGLAAFGATLVDGFDVVAEAVDLATAMDGVDLVLTGEGFLDNESFEGKVVGGVVKLASEAGVPVVAVAGQVFDHADDRLRTLSLAEMFGLDRAMDEPLECIHEAVAGLLDRAIGD